MSKMTRFFGGAVFATILLFGAGALSPQAAQAASLTSDQISAIIGLLQSFGADQATINNVQVSLNGGTPTGGGTKAWCHTFNSNLTVGSIGADVSALNQALSSSGIDTSGDTSAFDENTAADVVSFQAKYGIRQTGYVGPRTRAKLNSLYGCNGTTGTPIINSISPNSGPVGTTVTLKAYNFSVCPSVVGGCSQDRFNEIGFMGNGIRNGEDVMVSWENVTYSITSDGAYLATFQVPSTLAPGTYQVGIINCGGKGYCTFVGNGNSASFAVTTGTVIVSSPSIISLQPTSGPVGTTVTLTGTGFFSPQMGAPCSPSWCPPYINTRVHFGYGILTNVNNISKDTALTFQVPESLDPACRFSSPPCAIVTRLTAPGAYQVSVGNQNGTSNAVNFTVTSNIGTLSINPTSAGIKVGGTTEFQALFDNCPAGAQCFVGPRPVQATWTSSNPKVATVAYKNTCPSGATCIMGPDYLTAVVTGISLGTATITATYKDSSVAMFTASAPVSTVMQ